VKVYTGLIDHHVRWKAQQTPLEIDRSQTDHFRRLLEKEKYDFCVEPNGNGGLQKSEVVFVVGKDALQSWQTS
jgi:hypothetical protein